MEYLGYEFLCIKWCYSFKDKCNGFIFWIVKGCEIREKRMRRGIGLKFSVVVC